jgi:hypothetical protein
MLRETNGGSAASVEEVVVLDGSDLLAAGYVLKLTTSRSGIVKNVMFEKVE